MGAAHKSCKKLEDDLLASKSVSDMTVLADICKTTILDDMRELRISVDGMETLASSKVWPYPTYGEMLFGIR